jgi:hypothetical protein
MVETSGKERRAPAACAKGCCGGGGGGGSIAFGPFDASKLRSPMGSRPGSSASLSVLSGTSSPRGSPPSAPEEVAVVVASEAPPSPSRPNL